MRFAVDFIQDGIDLQGVVALNILEAVSPGIGRRNGSLVRERAAAGGSRLHTRQGDRNGIDLRGVVVVQVTAVAGTGNGRVGRMLIRPGGVSAGGMHHAKNGIGPNKVPGIDRGATIGWIAYQPFGINRLNSTFGQAGARSAAIQQALIDVNSFIVFGRGSRRHTVGHAGASCQVVAGGLRGRGKGAIVGVIVKGPHAPW